MSYLAKLLQMDIEPGSINIVDILHDDTCPKLSGGTCTCDPDVRPCPGESCIHHAAAVGSVN